MGCAFSLEFKYDKCVVHKGFINSNLIMNSGYNKNIRLVYGLRSIGTGYDDAVMFCS